MNGMKGINMDEDLVFYSPELFTAKMTVEQLINFYFGDNENDNNIGDC